MKNLPNVYANRINKKINNSQEYTTIETRETKIYTKGEIEKKINNIFKSENYIYKIKVTIVTDKGMSEKTLVGKNNSGLITLDNEIIPIDSIKDIYIK